MKKILLGLFFGILISVCCCFAKSSIIINPMQIVPTERNFVTTTKISTEEGTYRVFTIEGTNGGVGITAVKIK